MAQLFSSFKRHPQYLREFPSGLALLSCSNMSGSKVMLSTLGLDTHTADRFYLNHSLLLRNNVLILPSETLPVVKPFWGLPVLPVVLFEKLLWGN